MEKKMDSKKIWDIVKAVLVWSVVAMAVFMMVFTLISVNTFDQTDRNIFGFKFFIVQTDSMAATDFAAGDIVISRNVDPATLREGDIITFISNDPHSFGDTVTHKIRRLVTDVSGEPGFITYGTTTDTDDETVVTHSYVVGKYQGRIPKLGLFFAFLKTVPSYIVCILTPFLILIVSQGLNCVRLFRKYKEEQMDEMKTERARLEEERAENQRVMAELLELKARLAEQEGKDPTPPPPRPRKPPPTPPDARKTAESCRAEPKELCGMLSAHPKGKLR